MGLYQEVCVVPVLKYVNFLPCTNLGPEIDFDFDNPWNRLLQFILKLIYEICSLVSVGVYLAGHSYSIPLVDLTFVSICVPCYFIVSLSRVNWPIVDYVRNR
jgi:hypothetical protein